MNLHELNIHFGREELTLTNQRALFWKRRSTLVLSDLHLGKAAHFRKNGIPVPRQISLEDLGHLEKLLLHYQPDQVIVVGDLIHAGNNKEVDLFETLTAKFPRTKFVLIKGNHDRLPLKVLNKIGISEVYPTLQVEDLRFSHHARSEQGVYTISGHSHPGVRIQLPTRQFARFPCFIRDKYELVLPAFSRFTGLDTKCIPRSATCYAFYEKGIFAVR